MNLSDEELLYLVAIGSEVAFEELYNIYYHLVWKIVRECVYKESHIIDVEDLVLETLGVFMKLVMQYRSDKNASFRTYMKICIKHRVCTAMKQQYRIFLNDPQILHLDDTLEDNKTIADYYLKAPIEQQPDKKMIIKENVEEYDIYSINVLSLKEKSVYNYVLLGYTPLDICKMLDISLKSYYNTMYRISKKLSNFNMTLTS